MEAAVRHARVVMAEVNRALPAAARDGRLPAERTVVVHEVDVDPVSVPVRPLEPDEEAIGEHVAGLLPERCTLQFAPGAIGTAVLQAVRHPVAVDSGLLTDDVVALDERGMLRGTPTGGYLIGTGRLAHWADGRGVLAGVEYTHDPARLGRIPGFAAVNTALQIDPTGQVNVEGTATDTIAGIGGQADYALGASRSDGGLSIVAVPTTRNGRPTLVDRLDRPASTGRSDIGVVVTERGVADLRGVDDAERVARIRRLWNR
jgi:acyl-CoA hydrolase